MLSGNVPIESVVVEPGYLAYLGAGRDELALSNETETRVLLLGGVPFPEPILMWWNFVARTTDEVDAAYERWESRDEHFLVNSSLAPMTAPRRPWIQQR